MKRAVIALGALVVSAGVMTPAAHASPLSCEHRSVKHLEEHGGRKADDLYHLSRGELPACGGDDHEDNQRDDNGPVIHHRDRPGVHCRFLVLCG